MVKALPGVRRQRGTTRRATGARPAGTRTRSDLSALTVRVCLVTLPGGTHTRIEQAAPESRKGTAAPSRLATRHGEASIYFNHSHTLSTERETRRENARFGTVDPATPQPI